MSHTSEVAGHDGESTFSFKELPIDIFIAGVAHDFSFRTSAPENLPTSRTTHNQFLLK